MNKRKGFIRGALFGALAVLLVVGVVSCGLDIKEKGNSKSDASSQQTSGDAQEVKMKLLDTLIENYYTGDVDEEVMNQGIYKGYIEGLGDPYSVYYDQEETKALMESTSGEYSGVGAVLSQNYDSGIITILRVYENSPAQEAGLIENDILYKVNGEEVTGIDLTQVVGEIKGEEGTEVEFTVLRGEDAQEVTVTAVRRKIETQTVISEMKENSVGYIRISEFDTVTYEQYKSALVELESQGMEALVVDLRNNPGGSLSTVCEMLDLMLPEGLIVYTEDKEGEKKEYTSDEDNQFTKPLVVMVNHNSASASEIFAGAIQDYGTGEIIGTQSYGKGMVQQTFDLKDGTSVKLTIAEYFTPKGRSINGEGITPDVEVEYEHDENNPDRDNQLERALEILN